uniref:Uncharacterized protein n=1 Tax=Helianthus annuus TaxID=4232 RepID=A0A251UIQ5_HELAN
MACPFSDFIKKWNVSWKLLLTLLVRSDIVYVCDFVFVLEPMVATVFREEIVSESLLKLNLSWKKQVLKVIEVASNSPSSEGRKITEKS